MQNWFMFLATSFLSLILIQDSLTLEITFFEDSKDANHRQILSKNSPLYSLSGKFLGQKDDSGFGAFNVFRALFSRKKPDQKERKVSSISSIVAENESEITLRIMCETLGGTIIGNECLEFVSAPSTFIEARNICRRRGGDLYVPAKHEGFFFAKYFLYFRKAFRANSNSLGWIGALRGGAGAPVLTIDGQDVTMDAIYNVYTITGSDCVHIYLNQGNAFLRGEDCSKLLPFTCEYVFDDQATEMIKERNFVVSALNYSNKKYARIFHDFPLFINK